MKRLVSILVLAMLVMVPLSALAQDGPTMETFTSEDGHFSAMYPSDWVAAALVDVPLPGFAVANSQDALDRLNNGTGDLQTGEVAAQVLVLPTQFLTLLGLELPDNPTPVDTVLAFANAFLTPDPQDTTVDPASIVIGEPEEIMLGENEDMPAGYVIVQDNTAQGAFIVSSLDEANTLTALAIVMSYPGEFTDELGTIGKDITGSITYDGTADDLMQMLMGGSPTTAPTATPSADTGSTTGSTLDGAALVQERCTVCHTTARIDRQKLDEAGWTRIVDQMIGFGAQLNADERQAVIDYLVATH